MPTAESSNTKYQIPSTNYRCASSYFTVNALNLSAATSDEMGE
jgi:hypothetical protein